MHLIVLQPQLPRSVLYLILYKKIYLFSRNSKILEIWVFVSRLILIIFLGFEVFQLSDKSHIGSECPTFIGFLGSSNKTPLFFLLTIWYKPIYSSPSLCMTAVELVCTVGFFTLGGPFFLRKKKREKKLFLASFAF